jgi:tetratricopeptide (TPR) repeat protein
MRFCAVVALACCVWLTESRAQDWRDDRGIWQAAIAVSPDKPRPHVNYGAALQKAGQHQAAVRSYYTAIAKSYDERRTAGTNLYSRLSAETNLALILIRQEQLQQAWDLLDTVLANDTWPNFPHARYHRGLILALAGECQAARVEQTAAMRQDGMLTQYTPCRPAQSQ